MIVGEKFHRLGIAILIVVGIVATEKVVVDDFFIVVVFRVTKREAGKNPGHIFYHAVVVGGDRQAVVAENNCAIFLTLHQSKSEQLHYFPSIVFIGVIAALRIGFLIAQVA